MKTLKISENKALTLYKDASKELKEILEDSFGKEFFKPKNIIDRIKTINDVYEYLDIEREDVIPFKNPKNKQQKSINALFDIQNISKVLNEVWIPDFNNENEYKYYPYFIKKSSGWVVLSSFSWLTATPGGFGCYFKSSELSLYAGNQFLKIYSNYLPE